MNLREPIINEHARQQLDELKSPLSSKDRGSKQLIALMNEDDFISIY